MEENKINAKSLIRKVDIRLLPYLAFLYLLCFLDRVNIGYAKLYDLEKDLNLTQTEYSWSISILFFGYVLFEIPSNILLKKMSAPKWICIIMVTWGTLTMLLSACTNFLSLFFVRLFLGVAEAGLFPGIIYYLSFWYTKREQGIRTSFFFSASSLAGAFGSLIAYFINFLNDTSGLKSWQWIFIIEGIPSVLLGLITWFYLPAIPDNVAWLNENERSYLVGRLRDEAVITSECKFNKQEFISAFTDYKVYLLMLSLFGLLVPLYSMALLLPTIIKGFGFSVTSTFLLTAPPYAASFVFAILIGYNSDRKMERGYHILAGSILSFIGFLSLILIQSTEGRYIGCFFVVMGYTSAIPLTTSWLTNNIVGSTKKGVATAMVVSFANLGGVVAGQLYGKWDGPYFYTSHSINATAVLCTIVCSIILRFSMARENNKNIDNENSEDSYKFVL